VIVYLRRRFWMTMHPDWRRELGRQRQAALLAQADRDRLAQQARADQPRLRRLIEMLRARLYWRHEVGDDHVPEAVPLVEPD
jgi:hypothetical protein